jgi:hypothetical protein
VAGDNKATARIIFWRGDNVVATLPFCASLGNGFYFV